MNNGVDAFFCENMVFVNDKYRIFAKKGQKSDQIIKKTLIFFNKCYTE